MIAALDREGFLAILRSRVDKGWLDETLSTPDGLAIVNGLVDIFVEVDRKDAEGASSLFAQPHSLQVAPPASGEQFATTTLSFTLRKAPKNATAITLPAGTKVQTRDAHIYATDQPLTFAPGEVGIPKTTAATALAAGYPGVIPRGEINQFVKVANGISGAGVSILIAPGFGQPRALKLTTDLAQPHPWPAAMAGMYAQIVDVEDSAGLPNVGRVVQLASVNASATLPGAAPDPQGENSVGWGAPVNTTTDARYSVWATGTYGYTWQILDWDELGFAVVNTEPVVGGRDGMLDELANARGRGRLAGEDDEMLRARLARHPEPPSPLGLLRKALAALGSWGYGRHSIRIYEQKSVAPDAVDLYKENFPAAAGFIAGIHVAGMISPETPDPMCAVDLSYNPRPVFVNPGLALVTSSVSRWDVIVRWDFPSSVPIDTQNTIRRLLFEACKASLAPGTSLQLYRPGQWGF